MPLQATSGAASYDAFGGGVPVVPAYIEEVFSTWLTTGASANITVVNGIDLAGKGGLVWNKTRNTIGYHTLFDTVRGVNKGIFSNDIAAQVTNSNWLPSFNNDGFVIGTDNNLTTSGTTGTSWTFRKQPKFFDVVTYTGTGSNTTISHSLGSVPGSIIIKRTDISANWAVYHRSLANTQYLVLNSTAAAATGATWWNSTTPTSAVFSLGTDASVNASGGTYVAYIYAHDAGGFGLTGTDNVISCGSFTPDGHSPFNVNLGFEPQWVMIKSTFDTSRYQGDWNIYDNMRGMPLSGGSRMLWANFSDAEYTGAATGIYPTATGFTAVGGWQTLGGGPFIYIAIRRGPMKVPTDATKVFAPVIYTGNATARTLTTNFPVDLNTSFYRPGYSGNTFFYDRLRGASQYLLSSGPGVEVYQPGFGFASNTGITLGTSAFNGTGETYINYMMQRAPGFFDEVCYRGTGSNTTITHNLGAVPELIIVKGRSGATAWESYCSTLANTEYLVLNTTNAKATGATRWNSTTPTSSVFSIGTSGTTNTSAATYVAYLFATCAGVSKVGSYTGTGALQTINCGFTSGARFVLIKRTDSTGNWWVYDSARGITSGNDPYLYLNSTAAEVTGTNYVDTDSTGFKVTAAAPAELNASGGTYIFLAIA